jgi:hypothetical protein
MGKLTTNRIRLTLLAIVTLLCGHSHSPPLELPPADLAKDAAPAGADAKAFVPAYFQASPEDGTDDDPGFAANIVRKLQGYDLPPGIHNLGELDGLLSWRFVAGEPVASSFIIPPLATRPRRRALEGIPLPSWEPIVEWPRRVPEFPQGGPPRMLIPEPSTVALVRDALLCGLASGVVYRLAGMGSNAAPTAGGSGLAVKGCQPAGRRRDRHTGGERLA